MRVLAHLSDIHFGAVSPVLVEGVLRQMAELEPTITVVSGDLTQRARRSQFRDAKAFLDALPGATLVVPGNHDVPLWNFLARFLKPLEGYQEIITSDLAPIYHDAQVVIVGINTARSWTRKNGRINAEQVDWACHQLDQFDEKVMKVVVTHHPFDLAEDFGPTFLVGRAEMAMSRLAASGADVFLAGHHHTAYTGGTTRRYPIDGYSALIVQAGTATSVRLRGTVNSFNILRIEPPMVTVEIYGWDPGRARFEVVETKEYQRRTGTGFVKLEAAGGGTIGQSDNRTIRQSD